MPSATFVSGLAWPARLRHATATLQSPTACSGTFVVSTLIERKAEQMTMDTQGRRVSAGCPAVRPAGR